MSIEMSTTYTGPVEDVMAIIDLIGQYHAAKKANPNADVRIEATERTLPAHPLDNDPSWAAARTRIVESDVEHGDPLPLASRIVISFNDDANETVGRALYDSLYTLLTSDDSIEGLEITGPEPI